MNTSLGVWSTVGAAGDERTMSPYTTGSLRWSQVSREVSHGTGPGDALVDRAWTMHTTPGFRTRVLTGGGVNGGHPHHHGSHRHLLSQEAYAPQLEHPVDAIIVPTARTAPYLRSAVSLASELDCVLGPSGRDRRGKGHTWPAARPWRAAAVSVSYRRIGWAAASVLPRALPTARPAAIRQQPRTAGRAAGPAGHGQSCATSGLAASGLARWLNRRLA
jgi:hypothetical protein